MRFSLARHDFVLRIIRKFEGRKHISHQFQHLGLQERVLFVIVVAGNGSRREFFLLQKINSVWTVPAEVPVLVAAHEFRRPGLIAPLAIPAEVDAPVAGISILEVVEELRRASMCDFIPMIKCHNE